VTFGKSAPIERTIFLLTIRGEAALSPRLERVCSDLELRHCLGFVRAKSPRDFQVSRGLFCGHVTMKTSYGQQLCREYIVRLTDAPFLENYRPNWLFGMELDFFFPEHNVAIEFNGDQHYFATDLSASPYAQKGRDSRKRDICKARGIKLLVFKAIDLARCKFGFRFKKTLPMKKNVQISELDKKAKEYRAILKDKFNSPTAHRGKGLARQKTIAKLFEKHPPSFDGLWNKDEFEFQWNAWRKGKPKCMETAQSFKNANINHLRKRHVRRLDGLALQWEAPKF
jgi:hypothetical protein